MKRTVKTTVLMVMVLAIAMPAFATSSRVVPVSGYGAHDYTLRPDPDAEGVLYSSGLDVVYANLCNYGGPSHPCDSGHLTRCFLHVEATELGDKIRVTLHDYNGKYSVTLCEIDPPGGAWSAWPQSVKLDQKEEKVWFSYTLGSPDDWFYTVDWDPSLSIYPATATAQFQMDCNWEIEWSTDEEPWNGGTGTGQGGRPFFSGLNSPDWNDPHAIWVDTGGGNLQMVVNIDGSSCGFAFDNKGNLWSGAYTFSANKVFMWTAADVDAAADSGGTIVLQVSGNPGAPDWGPTVEIDLPFEGTTQLGASDVECDSEGNVYVSCNLGMVGPDADRADLLVIENDGVAPWPVQGDMRTLANNIENSDQWDWFRSLSFDGVSNLDDGGVNDPTGDQPTGNRIYVDMDFFVASSNPDDVVGICVMEAGGGAGKDDTDSDGVPDALDNAYLTANGPLNGPYNFDRKHQYDTNNDMYGNICDCDVDNEDTVGFNDMNILLAEYGGTGPDTDFDSDGTVGFNDFNILLGRWNEAAPFK